LFTFGCTSRKSTDSLRTQLIEADTILIVGHLGRMYNAPGHNDTLPPIPAILVNGKPNFSIIQKQKIITGLELDALIKILTKPVTGIEESAVCEFDPHHTIFTIKNGKTSFIDLCFQCQQFEASDNLKSLIALDNDKWSELDTFFRQQGVRFEQKYDYQK